ncbi:hypothetical protein SPRG_09696 [Saprolegnia parasitica CBS 223.65]|uniref:Uncharacterized protein n=1 Tax=Saprolegnia parasitica (strain CBS 223.65) TaxID=695850 RepID=A0A067C256_SAPPC|nr:hypothetical protein SPRG_09696 [Saprolegnia parasitica CBS 223.65]KDO24864.1 hypothetical protein SPRG_09696 [Saprolegnia parasitica CBS 223.65]|eukprot:XP_012204510.1 hypothetical protein SPRG_09696 [Saprolegnia parasitica CBS 223.65]
MATSKVSVPPPCVALTVVSSKELLQAYADPDESHLSLRSVVRRAMEREYVLMQFKRCQEQVGMDPNLLFFAEPYEANFLRFLNTINAVRVRITFAIGGLASALLFWYEATRLDAYDASLQGFSPAHERALYILTFGVIVPTFGLGFLISFWPRARRQHLERIAICVYWIVAMAFITKKWVQAATGPVLPLVILFIPIFNVTRVRFAYNCVLGWSIVITYFIVQLTLGPDVTSAIVFQSVNYSMGVIAGMVSNYQREILKRRNYTLGLPFQGVISDASSHIHDPRYRKEHLCSAMTQAFRSDELEQYFIRYWYLLDGSPYENPKAGVLHLNVYRGIRNATIGIFLNQITLSLQDTINLNGQDIYPWTFLLRHGGVCTLYALQYRLFYYYGRLYANLWRSQREEKRSVVPPTSQKKYTAPRDDSPPSSPAKTNIYVQTKAVLDRTMDGLDGGMQKAQQMTTLITSQVQQVVHEKRGYTHSAQRTTLLVLAVHISINGGIFFWIATTIGAKSVYLMGFLNALLSGHRSGFRLRFVYSSLGTCALSIAFVYLLKRLVYERFTEYMSYVLVVQLLGMIISYEEENLRRSFFIKKTLRLLEFQSWCHDTILLPIWIRNKLREKASSAKARVSSKHAAATSTSPSVSDEPNHKLNLRTSLAVLKTVVANPMQTVAGLKTIVAHPIQTAAALPSALPTLGHFNVDWRIDLRELQQHLNKENDVVSSASARYSKASRYGVYANSVNVLIATGQVIFFFARQ